MGKKTKQKPSPKELAMEEKRLGTQHYISSKSEASNRFFIGKQANLLLKNALH
jgi:hypothetical protein